MYQKVLLSGKDDKIDNLISENKKQSDEMKKQSDQIQELLKYAKETKEQNEELLDNIDDIKEQNDDLKDTMEDIKEAFKETADRSVPNPIDDNERHKFIGNDIELQYNYTLNDLLNKITEINNERFNEYNECP
jgi:seryl-tRNA synthetase